MLVPFDDATQAPTVSGFRIESSLKLPPKHAQTKGASEIQVSMSVEAGWPTHSRLIVLDAFGDPELLTSSSRNQRIGMD